MTPELLALLRSVDTPTVCNAIEVAQDRRGFDRFTRRMMVASDPAAPAVVGYARTATIAGAAPPDAPAETVRARRMDYYRYMAQAPDPAVAVIQDLDAETCVGAFWGEINATVHKGLGLAGALTNGLARDLGDLPDGFPIIAGAVGPSHAFVHVREIDCEVEILGMAVRPGELVHADRHGALVIPDEVTGALGAAIAKLQQTEKIVLEAARRPDFDFAKLKEAWERFEKART